MWVGGRGRAWEGRGGGGGWRGRPARMASPAQVWLDVLAADMEVDSHWLDVYMADMEVDSHLLDVLTTAMEVDSHRLLELTADPCTERGRAWGRGRAAWPAQGGRARLDPPHVPIRLAGTGWASASRSASRSCATASWPRSRLLPPPRHMTNICPLPPPPAPSRPLSPPTPHDQYLNCPIPPRPTASPCLATPPSHPHPHHTAPRPLKPPCDIISDS